MSRLRPLPFALTSQTCADPVARLTNAILPPPGAQTGWLAAFTLTNRRARWLPSGRIVNRPVGPEPLDANTILSPLGDQSGCESAQWLCVS